MVTKASSTQRINIWRKRDRPTTTLNMAAPINLRLAVCLFDDVTSLDYQGPIALFGFLEPEVVKVLPAFKNSTPPKYTIETTYLAHTLDPVKSSPGPPVVPSRTYDDVKADEQFDLILIPGGEVPDSIVHFHD